MIAILHTDLKFDMLALPYRRASEPVQADVLGQITTYYGVITKSPYLLMFVMMTTLTCIVMEILYDLVPRWVGYSSLVLIGLAMGVSIVKVIPAARCLATEKNAAEPRVVHGLFPSHIFLLTVILLLALLQSIGTPK
jgi:asparagine N-glycosylation enzyme membrane subunit Stt3